jgi:hypothetical protein
VLLGLWAAAKEDSNISAAEVTLGTLLTLHGQLITAEEPPVANFVEKICQTTPLPTRPQPAVLTDRLFPAALWTASFVHVQRGGAIPLLYIGPYQVLSRSPKFFQLFVGGKTEAVSVDRLKPHLGTAAVTPPLARPPAPADG